MNAVLTIVLAAAVLAAIWLAIARRARSTGLAAGVPTESQGDAPSSAPPASPARPDFAEPAVARILASTTGDEAARRDPVRLLEDAVVAATGVGTPSKLVLQRQLGLTFEQASDLVHRMEELGLIARSGTQRQHRLLPEAYAFAHEIAARRANSPEPNGDRER